MNNHYFVLPEISAVLLGGGQTLMYRNGRIFNQDKEEIEVASILERDVPFFVEGLLLMNKYYEEMNIDKSEIFSDLLSKLIIWYK